MFGNLSDADLMIQVVRQAEACERVVLMPVADRRAAGDKGQASAEQAGCMNAVFALLAVREAVRRGLMTSSLAD